MIKIKNLIQESLLGVFKKLAKKYFKFVEIKSIGKFTHNKLNKTSLHLNVLDEAELLLFVKINMNK